MIWRCSGCGAAGIHGSEIETATYGSPRSSVGEWIQPWSRHTEREGNRIRSDFSTKRRGGGKLYVARVAMMRVLCSRGLFAGLGALLLLGFTPLIDKRPAQHIAEPIKLGFSYLSAAQLKELWRLTGEYARAEV